MPREVAWTFGASMTIAMNTQRRITVEAMLLLALFALIALGSVAAPAERTVRLTGHLHTPVRTTADLILSVEVDGSCRYAEVSASGRFLVEVPSGATATLSFMQPGHLTKEVVIDTESAFAGSRAAKQDRRLEFDVVMEPEAKHAGQSFVGPVGSVGFIKGSGTVRVRHARQLSAADLR